MMKVLNYRDLGSLAEIMPGYFTVPQNPLVKGLAGTACNRRPQLNGLGQVDYVTDTNTGIDTSGVQVNTPTASQTDAALTAMAQSQCLNTPGSIWNPSDNSCTGSGSGSFTAPTSTGCPSGYSLVNGVCVQGGMNTNTYLLIGAAVVAAIWFMGKK